jgi:hypothetical protein
MSLLPQVGGRDACADLSPFRTAFYRCVSARADDCSTLNKQADGTDDIPAPAAAGIAETAGRVLAMAVGAASPSRPGDTAEIEAITDAMIRLLSGASGGGHRGISP